VPALQLKQTETDVANARELYVPVAQLTQAEAPSDEDHVPARQSMQDDRACPPGTFRNAPAGHELHTEEPLTATNLGYK